MNIRIAALLYLISVVAMSHPRVGSNPALCAGLPDMSFR